MYYYYADYPENYPDCYWGDLAELGDDELSGDEGNQVLVGICAMAKKSQSKPMNEILTRLREFEYLKMVVFPEEVILKKPVEEWPLVDCLISFHSKGFPLDKAIQYSQLRNPFIINNLHMQYDIQDRRKVYSILAANGIEIPRYAVLDRDSPDPKHHELVESEDHVEVNGVVFNKPFVEKPVSAEDHNIYIYYPTSAGGGSQRLFRKPTHRKKAGDNKSCSQQLPCKSNVVVIGSRSSVYSPESRVRKTGSFIYEDFMPTDGTDVKVYTVGPDYAHAEARKSPALDGKVERDSEGKEIRYPVILTNAEKLISRRVCLAFKQTVCGFDLLRANGKSYVCDVNGFSFVKNSNKYYDDSAKILGNMILRELAPTLHIPWSVPFQLDDPPFVPTTFGKMMELRCVVAVIRHGDRTPKQKMKVEVRHPKFFEIFAKYDGYKHGHVKLKRPKQLQEILDIARSLLCDIKTHSADCEIEEKRGKLEQLKSVLEMYGHFSGINRKVQMKYQPKGRPRGSSSDDGTDLNAPKEPSLVLILKWGGELTPAGRIQAEELGRIFRCMYPGGQGEYAGTQGLGLLRLHSTYRHDLKIYASDEGRVQMTAAAFAKGLLALEGELTPILVQMVKSANTNGLLDNDCDSSKFQNIAKARLNELMQQDHELTPDDRAKINPCNSLSIDQALDFVKNPVACCERMQELIQKLVEIVHIKRDDPKTRDAILYHGETWELMGRRWGKIEKDFSTKNKKFDISKIPDIYDCIKYDLQHNQHTLQFEQAEELYMYAKYMADIVIPQEYGLTQQEKLAIGQGICTPLLKKIRADLQRNIEEESDGEATVNRLNPRYSHGVSSPGRHVRTRLYFTSESHVHSLLTVLRFGGLLNEVKDEQWRRAMEYVSMVSELNYMSQIVVMLYEDPTKDPYSEERFHVELHFSPGVNCCVQKNLPPGPGFRPHSRNESNKASHLEESEQEDDNGSLPSGSPQPPECPPEVELTPPVNIEGDNQCNIKVSKPIPIKVSPSRLGSGTNVCSRLVSNISEEGDPQHSSSYSGAQKSEVDTEHRSRSFEQARTEPNSSHSTADSRMLHQSLDAVNKPVIHTGKSDSPQITISNDSDYFALLSRGKRLSSSADNILDVPDDSKQPTTSELPTSAAGSLHSSNTEHLDHNKQLFVLCRRLSCSTSSIASSKDSDIATPLTTPARRAAPPKRLSLPAPPHPYPLTSYLLTACPENPGVPSGSATAPPSLVHSRSSPTLPGPWAWAQPDANPPHASLALLERALVRRHRHSVSGQMSYFKMLGFGLSPGGGFVVQQKKPGCGSTSSLFSTAVISGSSSAPNLRDMIPSTPSISAIDGCGGVPPIRPLETLHNALSMKQLDSFLDAMTASIQQKTPAPSPPKVPSTPTPQSTSWSMWSNDPHTYDGGVDVCGDAGSEGGGVATCGYGNLELGEAPGGVCSGELTPCSAGSELEFEDDETVHASHSDPVNITRDRQYERLVEGLSCVSQTQGSPSMYLDPMPDAAGREELTTPVLTLASSFTDSSSIQRGFVIPDENLKK
ncbi:inositol hexakisphosphate and diphosphoinositol-pentakisphosphate kinase isoform X1 [Frankliniella occidentalis]|uniref:Inositol hexakisphosphate and diphosphoinositol-pentakisphosphate kinase n=1 Tax=Frankliniella occidentalis TaxID=133901 RepID=A0A9C6U3R1_FRAOC|nr:inositol hexakisphosphate and diphosphoinositol-pentakisphosphate kinase isoform X1 [Frankliniella occidentalis]